MILLEHGDNTTVVEHGHVTGHQVDILDNTLESTELMSVRQLAYNVAVARCEEAGVRAFVFTYLRGLGGKNGHARVNVDFDFGDVSTANQRRNFVEQLLAGG